MSGTDDFYISFGKYSGESLDDIPRNYLEWLLEQDFMYKKDKENLLEAIEAQLSMRDRSHVIF